MKTKFLTLLSILVSVVCYAQPGTGGSGDNNVYDVPIDGGLSLLMAAGAGYAAYRLKNKKEQGKDDISEE
jgi:hypothetical protein